MNVLIADDFPLFRRGVKDLLDAGLGSVQLGECGSAYELIEHVRRSQWDVVILDVSMPGSSGTETLKQLKKERPSLPVIVLSMHPEDQYGVRMFKAGAAGYLNKASAPEELVRAIKKVVAGGQYVSEALGEKLAVNLKTDSQKSAHEVLSDQEYEVLRLIASGNTVSEIAETLHLSVKTVGAYRARLLERMQLKNDAELTRYAVMHSLTDCQILSERTEPGELTPSGKPVEQSGLTPRQQAVIEYLKKGLSNKEIAQALGVTEETVKKHVHGIFLRTQCSSRTALVIRFLS